MHTSTDTEQSSTDDENNEMEIEKKEKEFKPTERAGKQTHKKKPHSGNIKKKEEVHKSTDTDQSSSDEGINDWKVVQNRKKQNSKDAKNKEAQIKQKEETSKMLENNKKDEAFRACNIFLYNVEEKEENDKVIRMANDMEIINNIITRLQMNETIKVESAFREGKYIKEAMRPRPIKIRLENEKQKWQLIGKNMKLKEMEDLKNVWMVPDLNYNERQKQRNLAEELKEKRINEGEGKHWYIAKNRQGQAFLRYIPIRINKSEEPNNTIPGEGQNPPEIKDKQTTSAGD